MAMGLACCMLCSPPALRPGLAPAGPQHPLLVLLLPSQLPPIPSQLLVGRAEGSLSPPCQLFNLSR